MVDYERICGIEGSAPVQGLNHVLQVTNAWKKNPARLSRNRFSHSKEVVYGIKAIFNSIAIPGKTMDYKSGGEVVGLLHDLGHPPGGHEGVDLISDIMSENGYDIEIDDNAQTFEVMYKHNLDVTDYEEASLIKYPNKLFKKREESLHRKLKMAIKEDVLYFSDVVNITDTPKRTLLCEVMDEADRNSYVSSDNEDMYVLGLSDSKWLQKELDSGRYIDEDIISFFLLAIKGIDDDNKTLIKKAFNKIRFLFHENYTLGDNLLLVPIREELITLRERMFTYEVKHFIKHPKVIEGRDHFLKILREYVLWVLDGHYPSRTYAKLIRGEKDNNKRGEYIRDMIFETSDLYIYEWAKRMNKKNKKA